MSPFQQLVLAGLALGLLMLGALFNEVRRLAKPARKFYKVGAKALVVPVQIAELTEKHLAEITVIAQNAVLTHDMQNMERERRAMIQERIDAKKAAEPALPETGSLVQGAKGPELPVQIDPLFGPGANNGRVEHVDPNRELYQGAKSGADGTA